VNPTLPTEDPQARRDLAGLVALSSLDGLGPATVLGCLRDVGGAAAWEALRSGRGSTVDPIAEAIERLRRREPDVAARLAREARALDAGAFLEQHEADGQRVVSYGDLGYPERLLADPAPPAVVFLRGSSVALDRPSVAIVGTRNATQLGRQTAARLAVELADRGVSILSGLALGIDGAAHRAVVDRSAGGMPVGVIATGLERAYPRRHQRLQQEVAAAGLVVTESPIGSVPLRWRFPARNRILAALADAVVVVESRSAGGSMLTAAEALARDRPVLAVPGHPTASASAGTLDLIADGAVPVRDVTDVLVALGLGGLEPITARTVDHVPPPSISDLANRLLGELDANPRTLGELVLAASVDLDAASGALVELEAAGLVARSGAWFERSTAAPVPAGSRRGR
jgi:DNA processing protein